MSYAFQRWSVAAIRIEVQADRSRELELGDAIIIARADEFGLLIRERHLRLENVEPRHCAGLEAILLILQLALQETNGFFLHADERAIQQHLVELRAHRRDHEINRVAKSEISGVALEVRGANLRDDAAAREDDLGRLEANRIIAIHCLETAVEAAAAAAVAGKIIQMRVSRGVRTSGIHAR